MRDSIAAGEPVVLDHVGIFVMALPSGALAMKPSDYANVTWMNSSPSTPTRSAQQSGHL